MKHILSTTIAAVLLVGCAVTQSQNSVELHSERDNANGHKEHVPEQKVEPPSISIHKAASIGDIEAVRQHLAAGTDPNLKSPGVNTPLFHGGYDMEIMTLLVENGADVNDIGGGIIGGKMTALHMFTDPEKVRFLIDRVADVNAIDDFGDTPLHKVVESFTLWRAKQSVEILIAGGADMNAINFDGLTPLDSLLTKSHFKKTEKVKRDIANLLRKHGARTSEELRPLDKEKAEDKDDDKGLDILSI
jgi:ankyrin repeat protein